MRQAAEHVARSLRDDILSGYVSPGTRLGEAELADRLSVSRTPVREALSRLAAEGLVELQPNRGARVSSYSIKDLHDIFELRLALEPFAARQAVSFLDSAVLDELDDLATEMSRAGHPGPGQDLDALVELNRRFHGLLIAAAGNRALASSLRAVTHASVIHQNYHQYAPDALRRSLAHHHEMVAAARAGDADWAEAVMRAHLCNARATMLGLRDPQLTPDAPTDGGDDA